MATKKDQILIVTMKLDPHADAVIDELAILGWEVFRLNTEDLCTDYAFCLTQTPRQHRFGEIVDSFGRVVSIREVHAAYYRKPTDVKPHPQLLEQGAADFSTQEGEEFLRTLYAYPGLTWINNPYAIRRAQIKLPQLQVAADLGFRIPRTLITNDPKQARLFCDQCNNDVICKSLVTTRINSNQGALHTYTHRLTQAEIDQHIDCVRYAPTLIQEWIPKRSEIRATVIGNQVFACEIDSQVVPEARVDWRVVDPHLIPHRTIALPQEVNHALINFVYQYDLQFGAVDMIMTPEGEFVFLENNPNGQWYWIEILTGMPLAKAMATLLTSQLA